MATTTIRRVLVSRTECAEVEVEADNDEEARQKVVQMIDEADCIADLDFEWDRDGGILVESLSDQTVEEYCQAVIDTAQGRHQ